MGMVYFGHSTSGRITARSEKDHAVRSYWGPIVVEIDGSEGRFRLTLDEAEALAARLYEICALERQAAVTATAQEVAK